LRQSAAPIEFSLRDGFDGGPQPIRRQEVGAIHADEEFGDLRGVRLAQLLESGNRRRVPGPFRPDRVDRFHQRRHVDRGGGGARNKNRRDGGEASKRS
jgi:hypothetical protein